MSRRIHALEAELGVPLIVRSGRTVTLTPAARDLVTQVRGPLHELELAVGAVTGTADPEHGTIRFGFPLTMGSAKVPDLLAAFHREHPHIRLHLKQAHGSALMAELRSGDLDLAITIPPPSNLRHVIIDAQPVCAVLSKSHPLATRKSLRLDMLHGETFIANPLSYNLRTRTEAWCRKSGFSPAVSIEITEFSTIRELIGRGLGIALLPHNTQPMPGVVEVPLVDAAAYSRDVALAWSPVPPTPASQQLSDYLQAVFADERRRLPRALSQTSGP